jgi:hypothetical protein
MALVARRVAWPALATALVCAWLLLRRRQRTKALQQPQISHTTTRPAERLLSVAEFIAERERQERELALSVAAEQPPAQQSDCLLSALPEELIVRILQFVESSVLRKACQSSRVVRACELLAAQARVDMLQQDYQLDAPDGEARLRRAQTRAAPSTSPREHPLFARLRQMEFAAVEVEQEYALVVGKAQTLARNLLKLALSQVC